MAWQGEAPAQLILPLDYGSPGASPCRQRESFGDTALRVGPADGAFVDFALKAERSSQ